MGNLPTDRTNPQLEYSQVDCIGPINVKDRMGRGCKFTKSYICLFVCFTTRAIHLELVSNLTTEGFILALRRLASRRGMPSKIYSDNGLNFVGIHNKLQELGNFILQNEQVLNEKLSRENFNSFFIPDYAPHFAGIWETGDKSTKYHLKRVIGDALLTYEDLYSVLTQIEPVLNSRPLSPLSSHPFDLQPLTPAHFLIGRPLTSAPDSDVNHIPTSRLSHYQRLQQIQQHFWKRWSKEYISELQCRNKWSRDQSKIKIRTLVIIKDDNAPPTKWLLGRVKQLHFGFDGVLRVVTIRTKKGLLKRATRYLCPLPDDSNDQSSINVTS